MSGIRQRQWIILRFLFREKIRLLLLEGKSEPTNDKARDKNVLMALAIETEIIKENEVGKENTNARDDMLSLIVETRLPLRSCTSIGTQTDHCRKSRNWTKRGSPKIQKIQFSQDRGLKPMRKECDFTLG